MLVGEVCVQPGGDGLGSNWHPDPDGDGVSNDSDLCPNIYDVEQGDADGDGVGDFCDPDFAAPVEGGPVTDLRAEHVTPYGAWFTMTSPQTTEYGKDFVLAWSTSRDAVANGSGVAALGQESTKGFRSFAYFGHRILRPEIITSMEPGTSYFVSVTALDDNDQPVSEASNVIEIKTADAPSLTSAGSHPRAFATSSQIDAMKSRQSAGDARWTKWVGLMGDAVLSADPSDSEEYELCLSAALLFHGTGEQRYKDAALALIDGMRSYWESTELDGNQLRWADSNLPICADLMWNELSREEHNSIVAAFLEDDEAVTLERFADTDEYASITRNWVVDGLVACDADGLDSELSARGCTLLEKGLRSFYGVQLVKARRNQGFFAQSGGALPDGLGYGWGTSKYWMHTLHALNNTGGGVTAYGSWVWHNFLSLEVHALTPMRRGYSTFGDLDAYDNFSLEPNSHPLFFYLGGLVAMQMGLMEQAGMTEQAGHAGWHLENLFTEDDYGFSWAMLLFDHDGIEPKNNDGLGTAFFDSGMGMFYDRSGWNDGDSYFVFRAGWSGVDHNHEDQGSFQLYRKGVWITHEALGYDGPAARVDGHNVPELEIDYDGEESRPGQFSQDADGVSPIIRVSSTDAHSLVISDLTGIYTSGRYHSFLYDAVQRHVLWLKPSDDNGDDRVIVYDLIDSSEGEMSRSRTWQMHIDQAPAIDGSRATFTAGDSVQVDLVHPQGLTLSYQSPQGNHSNFPGEVYTGRLLADAQSSDRELRYLSVLRGSESATAIDNVAVENSDVVGVLSGTDLVLFPRDPTNNQEEVSVDTPGNVTTVWWTGLDPNAKYSVSKSGDTLTLSKGGSLESDGGGLLVWSP